MASRRKWFIVVLIVIGVFAATYIAGWIQSYQLAERYFHDAESAYAEGKYLDALTGYEEFDPEQDKYIQRGGYQHVERIWSHPNAWPRPEVYEQARARIQDIISQRITIAMAETFVQANIGKSNPYLGDVYLRLGELYETDGDRRSAIEIYREIAELFPDRSDLIDRANDHLARLDAQLSSPN
jgi:tetratricopeptide (TPR) repeat protein